MAAASAVAVRRSSLLASVVARYNHCAQQVLRSSQTTIISRSCSSTTAKSGEGMTNGEMYNWRVAAVYNALAKRGKEEGAPLELSDLISLGHLDQYHYLGVDACDEVIRLLGLGPDSKVLDVGSGIGGPSRYISKMSGCDVTGVEIQADLTKAAEDLTKRVGLCDRVRFITGDFHELCKNDPRFQEQFDHFLSLLVFCHFPHRDETLKRCFSATKPGGTFLIEDLALVGDAFTAQELDDLHNVVKAPGVSSVEAYTTALEAAGFVDVEVVDMSAPWKAWTKARHESFRDSKDDTVRLHGQENFDSRCSFYSVIDRLFANGNLGGVKITGRRPGVAEERLRQARLAKDLAKAAHSKNSVLNEMGDKVVTHSNGTTPSEAAAVSTDKKTRTFQPLLPAGTDITSPRFHDSLQYHFFFPGMFVAGRVFHTRTLQQHSAWVFNTETREMKELFTPSYETMTQKVEDANLNLESAELQIIDGTGNGTFHCKKSDVKVDFTQRLDFTWLPAGQDNAVIHRPDLACTMEVDGKVLQGVGYSKRYFGPYPRYWGYRFIHGITVDGVDPKEKPACFWTADACFGDDKYNYYKLVTPNDEMITTDSDKTYQQDNSGYALVNGVKHEVKLRPLCTWETVIGGPEYKMESKMQNRYCEAELIIGGVKRRAVAYNERCYGTVG